MRPLRDISDDENFRIEVRGGFNMITRDPVEPEPVGTLVLMPYRITGYDRDCDGSLMARITPVHKWGGKLHVDGNERTNIGIYPFSVLVVTEDELLGLLAEGRKP